MTGNSVTDGKKINLENQETLFRRMAEVIRRVKDGTIGIDEALGGLQTLIERRKVPIWWKDEDGNFRLRIKTDGMTVEDWIKWCIDEKGSLLAAWENMLRSDDYHEQGGGVIYDLLIRPNWNFKEGETIDPKTWASKPAGTIAVYRAPTLEIIMILLRDLDNSDLLGMKLESLMLSSGYATSEKYRAMPEIVPRRGHVNRLLLQFPESSCADRRLSSLMKTGLVYIVV